MKWDIKEFELILEIDGEDFTARTIRNESQIDSFAKKAGVFFLDLTIDIPFTDDDDDDDVKDVLIIEVDTELTQKEIDKLDNEEIIELITENEWKSCSW